MTMRASLLITAVDQASASFARIASNAKRMGAAFRPVADAAQATDRAITRAASGEHSTRLVSIGMAAREVAVDMRGGSRAATGFGHAMHAITRITSVGASRVARLAGTVRKAATDMHLGERAAYGLGYALGWSIRNVGGLTLSLGKLALTSALAVAKWGALTAVGAVGWFAGSVIRTGAEFEQFDVQLRTITKSATGAKQAMSWIQKFAATTPYELAEVVQAFIGLKNAGLDAVDGTLTSLGNAASALNMPLQQAVDIMADATRFEFERLREFGIVGSQTGKQVTLQWIESGKTMKRVIKRDGAEVKNAINDIFNMKFGGGMLARSKTFGGLISNLKDKWTDFLKMVAEAGIFDKVKKVLADILAWLDKMAANGQLQEWAKKISDQLGIMFDHAVKFVKEVDWGAVVRGIGSIVAAMVQVVSWIGKAAIAWSTWQADIQRQNDEALVKAPKAVSIGGVRLWGVTEQERAEARQRLDGSAAVLQKSNRAASPPHDTSAKRVRPGRQQQAPAVGQNSFRRQAVPVPELSNRQVKPVPAVPMAYRAGGSEASRVFRRLLFVRRSHDECYKEQVFA